MSVEIELIYVEKPSKTTIEIDGKKYEGATTRKDAKVGKCICIQFLKRNNCFFKSMEVSIMSPHPLGDRGI